MAFWGVAFLQTGCLLLPHGYLKIKNKKFGCGSYYLHGGGEISELGSSIFQTKGIWFLIFVSQSQWFRHAVH